MDKELTIYYLRLISSIVLTISMIFFSITIVSCVKILIYSLEKLKFLEIFLVFGLLILAFTDKKYTLFLKKTTLLFMLSIFLYIVHLSISFRKRKGGFQFYTVIEAPKLLGLDIALGVDGFSLVMLLLTSFLFPLCLISFWKTTGDKVKNFCVLYFFLEALTLNVFLHQNILMFYIFFESVLVPMVLIIGLFGSRERRVYALYKFFFYTLAGSLITLVGIAILFNKYGTLNFLYLRTLDFDPFFQKLLWILFFTGFAVKIPMFPFHLWLPEAHAEAPTTGSVLLAGIMLKLGAYGFLRVSVGLLPTGSAYWAPVVFLLSALAVTYISLVAVRQIDLKRIIAYSSIAHMGFVTAGIFSLNSLSMLGGVFVMISHGLVSSGLFFCIGILYDRYKTRSIYYYSGLNTTMPIFSGFFLFFLLANSGLPGTSAFIGEFLVIAGCMLKNKFLAFLLATNAFLVATYSLWLYTRVCLGTIKINYLSQYLDVNKQEMFVLVVLASSIIILGLYPSIIIQYLEATVFFAENQLIEEPSQAFKDFLKLSKYILDAV